MPDNSYKKLLPRKKVYKYLVVMVIIMIVVQYFGGTSTVWCKIKKRYNETAEWVLSGFESEKSHRYKVVNNDFPGGKRKIVPGDRLEVRGNGFSDLVDLTFPRMYYSIDSRCGHILKYQDGTIDTIRVGDNIPLKQFQFRVRTLVDSLPFYIEGSKKPIS